MEVIWAVLAFFAINAVGVAVLGRVYEYILFPAILGVALVYAFVAA